MALPSDWARTVKRLYDLLQQANQQHNLTRITDYDDYLVKHIADSLLTAVAYPPLQTQPLRVADVGCGGGFPGLPLAVTFPQLQCVEIDRVKKKIGCVAHMIRELSLNNCGVAVGQGRELGRRPEHRGGYDVVVARAVGPTAKLVKDSRHLLADGGVMVSCKTPRQIKKEADEATREAERHKLTLELSPIYTLPADAGQRQFHVLRR